MSAPRTPRIQARLAGPSGLAAALVLGAAGPASASVHRAAVSGPGTGWAPAAAAASSSVTHTDSSLGAIAVLGACGLAGFLLLILGRRRDVDEPTQAAPAPPDLEAILRTRPPGSGRNGGQGGPGGPAGMGVGRYPTATATGVDGGPAPVWVKRLNDQAPPPPESDRVMDAAYRG